MARSRWGLVVTILVVLTALILPGVSSANGGAAKVAVHPRTGPPGRLVHVIGKGFGPNETVARIITVAGRGFRPGEVLDPSSSRQHRATRASQSPRHGTTERPNIVLVVTDDERWDTIWAMPTVQSELVGKGTTFTNAFVENSLCCPSRASILTGRPSHSTGVWTNGPPFGGFPSFDDASTIATWLQGGGYRTALIGKYLNDYGRAARRGYIPPGWDRWVAFAEGNGRYYDYDLTIDGVIRHFDESAQDYSTSVLARYADSFIRDTKEPFFLYWAVAAPHSPSTPAPGNEHAFDLLPTYDAPNYGEVDVSDKPSYVMDEEWSPRKSDQIQQLRRNEYSSLLAVDSGLKEILEALDTTGRLSNTMIVFTSDNGLLWGEHRLRGKEAPYEESLRVPLVVRYDVDSQMLARMNKRLVVNLDFAPTFARLAGANSPAVEGRSFLPLIEGTPTTWRTRFFFEHYERAAPIPSYCGVRTVLWKYVLYRDGFQELYDLANDPFELSNLASDPALDQRMQGLRSASLANCAPSPPDWLDGSE